MGWSSARSDRSSAFRRRRFRTTSTNYLDKLKNEGLVVARRESTFLRYTARTEALQEILSFLFAECCTRNKAINPKAVINA